MIRKPWLWVAPAAAALILVAGSAATAQEESTADKIKDKVGGAVQSIKKGAVNAEEAIKDQFARAKGAVVKMNIESRVYARLHWDKALVGAKIDLSAPKVGVIVLTGTVADTKAKAKAVDLTAGTVGVTEVIDRLTILTSATTPAPVKP